MGLLDTLFGDWSGRMQQTVQNQQEQYDQYVSAVEGLLGGSPQVDLSRYIYALSGYQNQILGQAGATRQGIMDSYNRALGDVSGYQNQSTMFSNSMLDQYMSSAGDIERYGETSLSSSLGAFDKYLAGVQNMANSDMPGMDIYRGSIGSNTAASIRQLKDMGGANSASVASALNNQNNQLRDLAIQSSQYKAQRQMDVNNAQLNYGNMVQGAYNNAIGARSQAAAMRGQGYNQAINTAMNNANLSSTMGNMGINANVNAYNVINNAYSSAASMNNQQANLGMMQFQNNQMLPYQAALQWNQNQAMVNNPTETQMRYYGDMMGLQWNTWSAIANGMMDMYSNVMGLGSNVAMAGL